MSKLSAADRAIMPMEWMISRGPQTFLSIPPERRKRRKVMTSLSAVQGREGRKIKWSKQRAKEVRDFGLDVNETRGDGEQSGGGRGDKDKG